MGDVVYGIDESGSLNHNRFFVLVCAFSAKQTMGHKDRMEKHRGKIDLESMPHYRFLVIEDDVAAFAEQMMNDRELLLGKNGTGSADHDLRYFSSAYLLHHSGFSDASTAHIDDFVNNGSVGREIGFYLDVIKDNEVPRCHIVCEPKADVTRPIVNAADALANHIFRQMTKRKTPYELDPGIQQNYVDIRRNGFYELYRRCNAAKIRRLLPRSENPEFMPYK